MEDKKLIGSSKYVSRAFWISLWVIFLVQSVGVPLKSISIGFSLCGLYFPREEGSSLESEGSAVSVVGADLMKKAGKSCHLLFIHSCNPLYLLCLLAFKCISCFFGQRLYASSFLDDKLPSTLPGRVALGLITSPPYFSSSFKLFPELSGAANFLSFL